MSKNSFKLISWVWLMGSVLKCVSTDTPSNRNPSPTLSYPGDIYVGIFIDLHRSMNSNPCGELNPMSVQKLWAAIWAIDTLNNQTEPNMPKLGLKIYDTCDSSLLTLHHTLNLLKTATEDFPRSPCENSTEQKHPNLLKILGVICVGEADVLAPIVSLSQLYSVPLLLASPSAASQLPVQNNVLTTAPTMASLVPAIAALIAELKIKSISTISSSSAAVQDLTTAVLAKNIAIVQSVIITKDNLKTSTIQVILPPPKQNSKTSGSRVVILMLEPNEIDTLLNLLNNQGTIAYDIVWVIACPVVDRAHLPQWGRLLTNAFLISPHPVILHKFQTSFLNALSRRFKPKSMAIDGYLQTIYNCSTHEPVDSSSSLKPCSQLTTVDLQKRFQQDPSVPFVSQAVSAIAAAHRMMQIDSCELGGAPCNRQQLLPPLFKATLASLMKLSVNVQNNEPMEVEGTRLKFTEDGKVLFKHFDVYFFNGTSTPVQIGWYSDNIGLNVNVVWRQRPWATRLYTTFSELEVTETSEDDVDPANSAGKKSWVSVFRFNHSSFVARGWATAVIILAAIGALMTAYIFVYVLIKICDRTLTGNQFLGILLLLSVICLYSTCVLFVLPPSTVLCNWRNFLHSFSYALCYSVLFVKVMQLRSLVSLGLGGRLSHLNQAFTLFYMVGLQVALNVQWSVLARPVFGVLLTDEHNKGKEAEPRCLTSPVDFVWSQSYVILLLIMTSGYALYTRNIRRNHNEGRWVLLACGLSFPIWITWITAYMVVPTDYQEAAVCAGLILSATVVVCTVFFPKIHTLNARHKAAVKRKELSSATSTATVFSLSQDLMDHQSGKVGVQKTSLPSTIFSNSLLRNATYDFKDKRSRVTNEKADAK